MKINAIKSIFTSPIKRQKERNEFSLQIFEKQTASSLDCLSLYNKTALIKARKEKAFNLATKIINDDSKIINIFDMGEYMLGTVSDNKDSIPSTFFNVCFNNNNEIKNIFLNPKRSNEVFVYDGKGELIKEYTDEDFEAIMLYKSSSILVTKKLRKNEDWGTDPFSKNLTQNIINKLTQIFKDDKKHFINEQDTKLFRAMHIPIEEIGEVGDIFTDKSFVSTSTDLKTPKDFSKDATKMPIMVIDFPKGAKYLDTDNMLNTFEIRWKEKEYLLNRDSRFLITEVNKNKNLIRAIYLLTDEEKANLNEN